MKSFEGIITSVSMNKTAIVEVSRRTPHPLYKKLIKRSKKYKADTGNFSLSLGTTVRIIETRPISRNKFFKVSEVLGKASKISKKDAEQDVLEVVKKTAPDKKAKEEKTVKEVKKTIKTKVKKETK